MAGFDELQNNGIYTDTLQMELSAANATVLETLKQYDEIVRKAIEREVVLQEQMTKLKQELDVMHQMYMLQQDVCVDKLKAARGKWLTVSEHPIPADTDIWIYNESHGKVYLVSYPPGETPSSNVRLWKPMRVPDPPTEVEIKEILHG